MSPWAHLDDERQRGRDELLEFLTQGEELPGPDPEDELERRRSAQVYFNAGLPWTAEFEERVNAGEVDVS